MMTWPLPPLFTKSRPWSKNWPNSVNQVLNGAEMPPSGVTLGIEKLGKPVVGSMPSNAGALFGSCTAGITVDCELAASSAAGLAVLWSAIRLEIRRGLESNTKPCVCA